MHIRVSGQDDERTDQGQQNYQARCVLVFANQGGRLNGVKMCVSSKRGARLYDLWPSCVELCEIASSIDHPEEARSQVGHRNNEKEDNSDLQVCGHVYSICRASRKDEDKGMNPIDCQGVL